MNDRETFSVGVFVVVLPEPAWRDSVPVLSTPVLLVRHAYGEKMWSLPGGSIKPGELVNGAAEREVKEESGQDISVGTLIGVFSLKKSPGIVCLFDGFKIGGELRKVPDDEIEEARYVRLCEIDKLPEGLFPAQRGFLNWYIRVRKGNPHSPPVFGHPVPP